MRLSRLERVLRLFTEVRPGEGRVALLMFANVFLILCSYYLVKPLREGWISVSDIQGLSKVEVKAYSSFGQSLLLLFVVAWYSRLANRLPRGSLITRATLFCMSNMVLFWAVQPGLFIENLPASGIAFYLWVGMFGVFVVAQFWAFAADLYTDEQGQRLIPLIAIGATSGAWFGSSLAEAIVRSEVIASQALLLVALLPLAASIGLTRHVDRRGPGRAEEETSLADQAGPVAQPTGASGRSGLSIVFSSRYLAATAVITLLLNWVNTNGENMLFRVVQDRLTEVAAEQGVPESGLLEFRQDGTTAFYSDFFQWVNALALFLQAFVASRLLKYGGFAVLLLFLPVIALGSYSAMALVPVLGIIKLMKVAENATDYSLNNTARHVLWLPVSAEMKYKGKPTIDSLFTRVGDGLAALTIVVGVQMLGLPTQPFFVLNVTLVVAWLVVSGVVIREHRRVSQGAESRATA